MFTVLVILQNTFKNTNNKSNKNIFNSMQSTLNAQTNHENKLKHVPCSNVIKKSDNHEEN